MKKLLYLPLLMCTLVGCDMSNKEIRGEINYTRCLLNSNGNVFATELSVEGDSKIYRTEKQYCESLFEGDEVIVNFFLETDTIDYILKIDNSSHNIDKKD